MGIDEINAVSSSNNLCLLIDTLLNCGIKYIEIIGDYTIAMVLIRIQTL